MQRKLGYDLWERTPRVEVEALSYWVLTRIFQGTRESGLTASARKGSVNAPEEKCSGLSSCCGRSRWSTWFSRKCSSLCDSNFLPSNDRSLRVLTELTWLLLKVTHKKSLGCRSYCYYWEDCLPHTHHVPLFIINRIPTKFPENTLWDGITPKIQYCAICWLFPLLWGGGRAHGCVPKQQPKKKLEKAERAETQMANVWAVLPGTSALVPGSGSHAMASAGCGPTA